VLVREQVEVGGLDERRDLIERGLVDEDRAEDGLLGLEAMGQVAGGAERRDGRLGDASNGIVLGHGTGAAYQRRPTGSPWMGGGKPR
jgi:hypothetical protein